MSAELAVDDATSSDASGATSRPSFWRRIRDWMTWRTLLVTLLVVHLAPIWVVTYLPTQDGPAHIYNSKIFFEHFDHANFQVRQFHNFGYELYPNVLTHLLLGGLQQVFPPLFSEKLVVSLIVALLPLSMLYLLNSIERGRGVMCLIGFTFAYHNLLHIGFYNFSLSVSLCFFALGWWWRYRDDMTPMRVGMFYVLALLTHLSHFAGSMALLLAITIAGAWMLLLRLTAALLHPRSGQVRARLLATLRWSFTLALVLVPLYALGWDYNFRHYNPEAVDFRPREFLDEIFWKTLTLMSYSDWHLKLSPYVLWTTAGVAGLTVLYRFVAIFKLRLLEERDALLLIVAALVYLFFTQPWSRNAGGWVNDRLYIFAFLFLWLWFGRFHRWLNIPVGVVLIGLSVAHTGRIAIDYWRLQPELHQLAAAVNKIEPHSTVIWELDHRFRAGAFPGGTKLVQPFLHAMSYYGLSRDVVLFNNYEAQMPYFLTRWGEAPRDNADYIVAFGFSERRDPARRHSADYTVVHESPNLVLLQRKQSPPDLQRWTTLPDGRLSLRLRMGDGRDAAGNTRGVERGRQFRSGSFGWVRTVPRFQQRGTNNNSEFRGIVGDLRDRAFRIDLPNARYRVTLHFAPHPDGRYETRVIANDARVGGVVVEQGAVGQTLGFETDVRDGRLFVLFYTTQRGSPDRTRLRIWGLSGIEVEQLPSSTTQPATTTARPAD
jgi:hypothetical protein